jgi:xanthine dehydrogenase YagR molybdenum-binding subunit
MRKGDLVYGWGVAAAAWGASRQPSEAAVFLRDDGTANIACATQDIGTGTYTVLAQVVRDKVGIPIERIEVALGDQFSGTRTDLWRLLGHGECTSCCRSRG